MASSPVVQIRFPSELLEEVQAVCGGKRSAWVLAACRMRLDVEEVGRSVGVPVAVEGSVSVEAWDVLRVERDRLLDEVAALRAELAAAPAVETERPSSPSPRSVSQRPRGDRPPVRAAGGPQGPVRAPGAPATIETTKRAAAANEITPEMRAERKALAAARPPIVSRMRSVKE